MPVLLAVLQRIGRYDIVEQVGQGGMGVLYRAHDPVLDREVAIKTMHVDFAAEPGARERFEREARAVAKLQHQNVVTIHELGEVEGTPYIAMEFLSGQDLDALIRREPPPSLDQKLDFVVQLLAGLAYAHERGIVHRDIKPGNVRVLEDGTVKILDFGIAKFAHSSTTHPGQTVGSPAYMAPEHLKGEMIDGRADLFSVGVLLYELLSGRKPFVGDSPTAVVYGILNEPPWPLDTLVPGAPSQLTAVVERALEKDPHRRFASASEMAAELQLVRLQMAASQAGPLPGAAAPAGEETGPGPSGAEATGRRPAADASWDTSLGRQTDRQVDTTTLARPARLGAWVGVGAAAGTLVALGLIIAVLQWGPWRPLSAPASETPAVEAEPPQAEPVPAPEAPAAPPPSWTLAVTSVPPGASIFLDDTDTEKVTPAEITATGDQPETLRLVLEGFYPREVTLTEKDFLEGTREEKLVPESARGSVNIAGSYPFEVVEGTRVISEMNTSHRLQLRLQTTTLRLRNPEYFLNESRRVTPRLDRSQEIPAPELGTLAVFAAPAIETCVVLIDDREVGFPPIAGQVAAAGSHRVTLRCPDGAEGTQNASVEAGQKAEVTFKAVGK